jgi:hypothetical protein
MVEAPPSSRQSIDGVRQLAGSAWRTDRRGTLLRAVGLAVLVVATIDFFVAFLPAVHSVRSSLRTQGQTSLSDRRLAPAFNYDVSRAFEIEAQRLLPVNASYYFETGPHAAASHPTVTFAAPFVTRYLLMPRRVVTSTRQADWLLCYGCRLGDVDAPYRVVWREADAPGLLIARLRP